jgi:hypothetical protein
VAELGEFEFNKKFQAPEAGGLFLTCVEKIEENLLDFRDLSVELPNGN